MGMEKFEVFRLKRQGRDTMNTIEYVLTCLSEECAEVQQNISKALRFGLDDTWKDMPDNATKIAIEYADLIAVAEMLEEMGVISAQNRTEMISAKKAKVLKYMEYARKRGCLHD